MHVQRATLRAPMCITSERSCTFYAKNCRPLEQRCVTPPDCEPSPLTAPHGGHAQVDDALELEPDHAASEDLLQTMAECAGVYADEATKLMLLGQSADAATNLTHAMQLQPHAAELRIRRAAALRQQGKLREAIGDLEVAISEAGGTYPEAGQLLVLAYNDLGVRLAQQKLHEEAVRWFSSAIDANGSVAAFFLNRADCLHALGRTVEALADLERARDLSPHDAQTQWSIRTRLAMVHNDRGTQLFNHADARQAAVEFSRAIECNPKVAGFFVNRAEAMMQLNRYADARDDLLAALSFNADDERAQRLLSGMCPD